VARQLLLSPGVYIDLAPSHTGATDKMARACNQTGAPGQATVTQTGGRCFGFASAQAPKRAFTLVEVIVGAAILALTVVALYGAFSFGFSTIKVSQEDVRADQILVQKLETLRVYDWTSITNNYVPTNFTGFYSTNGGVTYEGSLSVAPFVATTANETYTDSLRQVTVSVDWISGGIPRTRSMTTLVSQYGIQTYKP
jgi:prepilin-type N-terminal cleavage/methylation domain-containing protein